MSQAITVKEWTPNEYAIVALAQPQAYCYGYYLDSSVALPGGGAFVDCIGNCETGRGYCYAQVWLPRLSAVSELAPRPRVGWRR